MNSIARILVISEGAEIRHELATALRAFGYIVNEIATCDKALGFTADQIAFVFCDYEFREMSGISLMRLWVATDAKTRFILLDRVDSSEHAKVAIWAGAADYFPIAVGAGCIASAARGIDGLKDGGENQNADESPTVIDRLFGTTPVMVGTRRQIERIAGIDTPALLLGESGTGKSLAAEVIHKLGPRGDRPLIVLTAGEALAGADGSAEAIIKRTDGGTLLLDEVGDFNNEMQIRVLALLERLDRILIRAAKPPFRLLAATNQDLYAAAKGREFRSDLLYRLGVVTLTMPPLRERWGDIKVLTRRFAREITALRNARVTDIDPEVIGLLEGYSWPGNVRELRNTLEGALVLAENTRLKAEDLPCRIRDAHGRMPRLAAENAGSGKVNLDDIERVAIEGALAECNQNRTHAAAKLGISVRTLQRKLRQYQSNSVEPAVGLAGEKEAKESLF